MTEDFVKEVFRSREHLVDASGADLAGAVRRRVSRRRTVMWLAAGGLTLVTTLGVGAAALTLPREATGPADTMLSSATPVPPGWRLESSLGAQISVPEHWEVNDYGCNMTDRPSVVRGQASGRLCLTPEPATKEVAIVQPALAAGALSWADQGGQTTVDGVPALRLAPLAHEGRHHAWIHVPSRDIVLVVRALDRATAERILGSFRLVDPDHLGCTTKRPPVVAQQVPPSGLVPSGADSVSACLYGAVDGRLVASAGFGRADAAGVVAGMNAAAPSRNPDPPQHDCARTGEPAPDVVLLVTAGGQTTRVWVTFTACTGRGLDNGVRQGFLADSLLHTIMRPLRVAYGLPNGPAKGSPTGS